MTKKQVTESAYCYVRGLSLKDLKESLDDWIQKYGENATLEIDEYYDGCIQTEICYGRLETDEEEKARIEKELESARRYEAQQRAQFELLKKKYGN